MSPLSFAVVDARAEPHAAVPTLMLQLRITSASPEPVHAVALRCQIMIEPQRRRYERDEQDRLTELFGDTPRWGDTLRPFLWANVGVMVSGFEGSTDVDLPVTCTYDMEIAATKYFHSLDDGEIPIVLLFSGTAFARGSAGLSAAPIAWHEEAKFRLPVATWRAVMDMYFPNCGWLRLRDETFAALQQFRAGRALLTWDETIEVLLKEAGEGP
jgi:Family of unknown function (DUF6084)